MHHELIKAEIRMRGSTLAEVAEKHGLSLQVVSLALKKPSLSGEKAIADSLGMPLHKLWPKRWTEDGRRIRPRWAHLYVKGKEDAA